MHDPVVVFEVRETAPVDGWRTFERTGRVCVVCPCGRNTGFVAGPIDRECRDA